MRIGDDLEVRAVVMFEQSGHENRRRVAEEIAREIADPQLSIAIRDIPAMLETWLGAECLSPASRHVQLQRMAGVHGKQAEGRNGSVTCGRGSQGRSFLGLVARPIANGAALMQKLQTHTDQRRVERDSAGIRIQCIVDASQRFVSHPEIAMNLREVRLDRERLFIIGHGAGEIITLLQQIAEVAIGSGEIGIERNGLSELRARFIQAKQVAQDVARREMRACRVRPFR